MGSWFSNIQIRKCEAATEESVAECISKLLAAQQYLPAASESDADGAVAIVCDGNHPWISVYSDLLTMEEPKAFAQIAAPLSAQLHTDVLGISCFDSDYLFLNLINAEEKTDAWVGIGRAAELGIKRRSGLAAWKNKVSDFEAFSKAAKEKYVFAEEFLGKAESCLGLPERNAVAGYEYLKDLELDQKAKYFYFKLPEGRKTEEPPKLVPYMDSRMPAFLECPHAVSSINIGGESKGLSVFFLGPYIEKEEITFSDVGFVKIKNGMAQFTPFELLKVQLSDGQWAYYYHDPGFHIPPNVDDRLSMDKQMKAQLERHISVRFIPHGNPRKVLDITVVLVPDKNPEGQTGWNVWMPYGTKKAFFDAYNETWKHIKGSGPVASSTPNVLKEEDFG